jgi:hypothetical protein
MVTLIRFENIQFAIHYLFSDFHGDRSVMGVETATSSTKAQRCCSRNLSEMLLTLRCKQLHRARHTDVSSPALSTAFMRF